MKRTGLILVAAMALAAMAEQAEVRVLWGTPKKTVRAETRRVELERLPDGAFRAVVRKGEIPADAFAVEVVPAKETPPRAARMRSAPQAEISPASSSSSPKGQTA